MPRPELTVDQANARLEMLRRQGVSVYDLRGKTPDEKAVMMDAIHAEITERRLNAGVPEDSHTTFVAGSGKTNERSVRQNGRDVGRAMRSVVTGGSSSSVMGSVAVAADVRIGVTCEMIMRFEQPDRRYQMMIVGDGVGFDGMEDRLRIMREISHKELAMQGGMGTLEEILGGVPVRQQRGQQVRMLLPFWQPLQDTFARMYDAGYLQRSVLDAMHPVDAVGNEGVALSQSFPPPSDSKYFQERADVIVQQVANNLRSRTGAPCVLGTPGTLEQAMRESSSFLLAPGDITALHQATMIACEKRMDHKFADGAPNPGIAKKPLLVLNIDGFYDGFMEQWRQMERGGYLSEPLDSLMIEVQLNSQMSAPEIRMALAKALPREKPQTQASDSIIR